MSQMRRIVSLCWIELQQSRHYFLLLSFICVASGGAASLSCSAIQRLTSLAHTEDWGADLLILPKGMGIEDFRTELLSGEQKAYLPKALFETTFSLARGAFELQAVLPHLQNGRAHVASIGKNIGTQWLVDSIAHDSWAADLVTHSHPIWGKDVIAAIFAAGPQTAMAQLKDLIDQKTVAQAFFIKTEQSKAQQKARQIELAILSFLVVLGGLSVSGATLVFLTLAERLKTMIAVMRENGMGRAIRTKMICGLALIAIILPSLFGFELFSLIFSELIG